MTGREDWTRADYARHREAKRAPAMASERVTAETLALRLESDEIAGCLFMPEEGWALDAAAMLRAQQAEIERLRGVEAAARAVMNASDASRWDGTSEPPQEWVAAEGARRLVIIRAWEALRAALAPPPREGGEAP